ncbi:efflux RND transporter periplasmic adaptor subunit [Rubrimonas cliftonensis]|uniref:Membrane fusion protein, Cu(I)/Ag(I) efflux system n=1 Tax=Rubrimonas cliftonensis TaxID=89524 RepID=A0A1H4FTE6_9RHOB|nr:efflux RND transporter periplasmic adaptor subunit [Rubrimonas cliftonensis]SEB00357.1 membrane fusion protein, Cu(I)/Ag(I) efflux system [Rubrimonas cliftonensis]
MRGRYTALSILMLGAGLAGGVALERLHLAAPRDAGDDGPAILYWVAPMDANFRRDAPGKSPMGMDLIPVYEGQQAGGDPEEVRLSPAEINAIGVRTAVARVEPVAERIETVGFVAYDDHATSHIHMRTEGWIERLEVRSIGDRVAKGDLLFELYAPEITVASLELQRGVRRGDRAEIDAATRKLRNYGVTEAQIAEMAASERPADRMRVLAPQDGVVISLEAADGMYLRPEVRAMSLTDLSDVWLIVDVFERDIGRLTEDRTALARFDPLPGRAFEGVIDYMYPELDPKTRTLPVRLRFDNSEGLLRPGMFGTVALEPAEAREAVTVPAEAVIRTGRAERVILRTGDGVFRPRLVTTGLTDGFGAGGRTEIVQGLAPGEEVVASAQFLIDSESALNAGLTRMAPTDDAPAAGAGLLSALDAERRQATIRHEPIPALDWPAMETRFALRADIDLSRLAIGDAVRLEAARGADGLLALTDLRGDDGVDATGTGLISAVTPDGRITLEHDPIPALGWPSMTMDMEVAGFDPADAPLNAPVEFDLAKGDGGLYVVTAVRPAGGALAQPAPAPAAAPDIVVSGRIVAVDRADWTATVAHGPIAAIGMPGMTMDFALAPDADPDALPVGAEGEITFARPDGMTMVLQAIAVAPPPMAVDGVIDAVDAAARTATITHGPMAEIGMPGMTMAFALGADIAPDALPLGREVRLLFRQNPDFSMTLVGVEPEPGPSAALGVGAAQAAEVAQ